MVLNQTRTRISDREKMDGQMCCDKIQMMLMLMQQQ